MRPLVALLVLAGLAGCSDNGPAEQAYLEDVRSSGVEELENEDPDEAIAYGLDLCDIAAENGRDLGEMTDYLAENVLAVSPEYLRAAAAAADSHLC